MTTNLFKTLEWMGKHGIEGYDARNIGLGDHENCVYHASHTQKYVEVNEKNTWRTIKKKLQRIFPDK